MSQQRNTFCPHHNEEFLAIEKTESDKQEKKLCLRCLANGYKGNVVIIDKQIQNVQIMKTQLIQSRQEQIKINIDQLEDLIKNIATLKQFYDDEINKISTCVEEWIKKLKNMKDLFEENINKQEVNDLQEFLNSINQFQSTQIKELSQSKIDINKLLQQLKEPDILQACDQILINLQSFPYLFQEVMVEKESEKNKKVKLNIFCKEHQKNRIKFFDLRSEKISSRSLACDQCFDDYPSQNYKSVKFARKQWNNIVKEQQKSMQNNLLNVNKTVYVMNQEMQQIQNSIKKSYEKYYQKYITNYNQYELNVEKMKQEMNIPWELLKEDKLLKIVEDMNKSTNSDDPLLVQYTEQKDLVNQLMIDNFLSLQECTFNQIKKFNPLIQNQIFEQMKKQQKQNQSNHNLIEEIKDEQNIRKITKKNFTYHLIKESSIKEQQQCNAMAFNKDCSIVLVGCNQQIQVFEFKQGMMKQIQILKEHENNVITLNFMKKSNQFISGSEKDGWIIIWSLNSINNQWILQQKLKKHSVGIICLVLNENEDLFVSGGFDNKIIFWGKKNQWILEQTLDLKQRLYALSINEEQSRLIICSFETEIFILEFQQQKWIIQQKILVQQKAIRISFISNNLFTVQSFQNDLLDIYEMENQLGYIKTRGIIIMRGCGQEEECLFFPSQYIKSKNLLVIKNCQYINLIKIKENREFIVENSIQYQTSKLYGSISDDGEYLITWDQVSKEIQIRKLQES